MIQVKKISGKDIYSISIGDTIDQEGIQAFTKILEEEIAKKEKIKLIAEFNQIPGFEGFKAFTETMKVKFKAIGAIGKYAVLSDKDWVKNVIPIGDFFTPGMPLKHFRQDEKEAAISWLESDEA